MKVKDLPLEDRPREKLALRGIQSLSDAELLAVLLRTGTKGKSVVFMAIDLMNRYGGLNALSSQSMQSLIKTPGLGKGKAASLLAAFELGRRIDFQKKWFSNKTVKAPSDIAELFMPLLRDELQEKFYVVCLNTANKIIKYEHIFTGSLNASLVHPREVFKAAIENSSASIILLHNHPSGNAEPSSEDIQLTRKMADSGKILDIPVIDHVIIAGNKYASMVEKRVL